MNPNDCNSDESSAELLLAELERTNELTDFQRLSLRCGWRDRLRIGPYLVESQLDNGELGPSYKAIREKAGQSFVLRRLSFSCDEPSIDRCIKLVNRAGSDALQTVVDVQVVDEAICLVSPFVEGESVASWVERHGPLAVKRSLLIIARAVEALAAAAKVGFSHSRVGPSNIVFDAKGHVTVLDTVPSILFQQSAVASSRVAPQSSLQRLGTLPPEMLAGNAGPSVAADIYSLGCVFFILLTGRLPFVSDSRTRLEKSIRSQRRPKPSRVNASVPAEFDQVVRKMLAIRPSDRYQDWPTLHRELRALSSFDKPAATTNKGFRVIAIWSGIVVLLGCVAVGWKLWPKEEPIPSPSQRQVENVSADDVFQLK